MVLSLPRRTGAPAMAAERPALAWRGWRFAAATAAVTVALCLFATFFLPGLLGSHQWLTLGDGRWTVLSTQYVTYGGLPWVYSATPMWLPLPGFLLVLAPAVAIGDHLGLVTSYPFNLPYPSMYLLVAPVFALAGSTAVLGVDYLADSLRVSRFRRRLLAVAVGLLVVVPTVCWAGHPEDVLCLGLSSLALGLLIRGRHLTAASVLAVAVMMQPWALVLIPLVVAASPPGARVRSAVYSSALPAVTALYLLAMDFKDTFRSLVVQPMLGHGQHLPWWGLSQTMTVVQGLQTYTVRVGSGPRFVAVLVALVGAWWIRKDPSPANVMTVASLDLAARGVFELQVWCYYLAPAAVFMAVLAASHSPSRRRWILGAAAALVYYGFAAGAYTFYSMPALLALAIMVLCTVVALRSTRGGSSVPVAAGPDLGRDGREHPVDEAAGLVGGVVAGQLHRL